eukprot:CAMPEP_0194290200 /NCGR_PEP_ID=MMETSP0169-20130528/40736_1 /TAXON_ID=218684 /ORGANISM="Corethron pennatum, Strain L29A3" /LENGTH=55 /DNA_ID=CAMNT_0039037721 /DNA_START=333 /DNA_END=497 /DNA_ORIENTATION=+
MSRRPPGIFLPSDGGGPVPSLVAPASVFLNSTSVLPEGTTTDFSVVAPVLVSAHP